MNKVAREITKHIARQWAKEEGLDRTLIEDYDKTVKCFFMDCISTINNTELKKQLQHNEDSYLKYLKRCITRLDPDYADTLEQASLQDECTKKKMSARNASNGADRDGQKFSVTALMKSLKKISYDDTDQLVQTFDDSLARLSREKRHSSWLSLFDRLIVVSDGLEVKKTLNIYLWKLAPEVDICLNNQDLKIAEKLHASLKGCLTVLMTRHFQNLDERNTGKVQIKDLIVSLMSLYLDLSSLLHGDKPDKDTVGYMTYVLREFRANSLAVLLQQTACPSAPVSGQFARCCLKNVPVLNDSGQYLHYILCVSKFRKQLPLVFEKAKNICAPPNFLEWLGHQNHELTAQMPDDRKFKGRQITNFLLVETSEEFNSQLLDVLTIDNYSVSEHAQKDEEGKSLQTTSLSSYINIKPAVGESLEDFTETTFFVDKKGQKTTNELTDMEMNSQAENKAQSSKDLHTTESTTDNMEVFEVDLTSLLSQAKPLEHSTPRQTQSNIEKGKGSTNKQKGQKNVSLHQKKQEVIDLTQDVTADDDNNSSLDGIEILEVDPATQSQSSIDHIVTSSTVNANFTSPSKPTAQSQQQTVSPSTKSSDSDSIHFTTDEEDEMRFSNLISAISDEIVSPVRSPPSSLSSPSPKKKLSVENLGLVEVDSDSDVNNSLVKSCSFSSRKRKQKRNLLKSSVSVTDKINEDISYGKETKDDLKLGETEVTSSESKKMALMLVPKSNKLLNLAHSSGSKLKSSVLDDVNDDYSPCILRQDTETCEPPVSFRTRSVVHSDQTSCVLPVVDSQPEERSKLPLKGFSKSDAEVSPKRSRYSLKSIAKLGTPEMKSPVEDSLSSSVVSSTVSLETEGRRTRLRSHSGSASDTVTTSPRIKSPQSLPKHQDIVKAEVHLAHEIENTPEIKPSPSKCAHSTNTIKTLRLHSPTHSQDAVKSKTNLTSESADTLKRKPPPSESQQLTKTTSTSPSKGLPDKKVNSGNRSSPKKNKSESDVEERSQKNVFKEDARLQLGENVSSVVALKRMSLDSRIKNYSLRTRVPDSPHSQRKKDCRKTEDTPTKKARVYDLKDNTPLQQDEKKLSALRRKSSVADTPTKKARVYDLKDNTPLQQDEKKLSTLRRKSSVADTPTKKARVYDLKDNTPLQQDEKKLSALRRKSSVADTPTKKARVYDLKDNTPLQQDEKKLSALRRKSSVADEVQSRRYSLRTRRKADS